MHKWQNTNAAIIIAPAQNVAWPEVFRWWLYARGAIVKAPTAAEQDVEMRLASTKPLKKYTLWKVLVFQTFECYRSRKPHSSIAAFFANSFITIPPVIKSCPEAMNRKSFRKLNDSHPKVLKVPRTNKKPLIIYFKFAEKFAYIGEALLLL